MEPYRSTVCFCDWLEKLGYLSINCSLKLIDIGCGQGANIYYLKKRYPLCEFLGIDINEVIVNKGNVVFEHYDLKDCCLEVGDLYDLDKKYRGCFDGLISLQTLSSLPCYKESLDAMVELNPEWIAISALFYEGRVTSINEVEIYDENYSIIKQEYYNVYSLPAIKAYFLEKGYDDFQYLPFTIDIDIPRAECEGMGTYTKKLADGVRIQISGPLLMPWGFIVVKKIHQAF